MSNLSNTTAPKTLLAEVLFHHVPKYSLLEASQNRPHRRPHYTHPNAAAIRKAARRSLLWLTAEDPHLRSHL